MSEVASGGRTADIYVDNAPCRGQRPRRRVLPKDRAAVPEGLLAWQRKPVARRRLKTDELIGEAGLGQDLYRDAGVCPSSRPMVAASGTVTIGIVVVVAGGSEVVVGATVVVVVVGAAVVVVVVWGIRARPAEPWTAGADVHAAATTTNMIGRRFAARRDQASVAP